MPVRARPLTPQEVADARWVYLDVLPYDRIQITDLELGSAVTLAGRSLTDSTFYYTINWGKRVFEVGARAAGELSTFIHELCHVWQGENGVYPTFYMGQSILSQLTEGLRDVWTKREWHGWNEHRAMAYIIDWTRVGENWNNFNVEQQAMLVQSWFISEHERRLERWTFGKGTYGGGASPWDARFPYLRDVVRARDRNAPYRAIGLSKGGDPVIKSLQDRLVELGYLEARYADGILGQSHSATLDALCAFQQRNGLTADRNLGGPNSDTRHKLALPASQLVAAP